MKILFLCTGNSCRSQMAEGWTRHYYGGRIEAYSAGIIAGGMNPLTMQVMKEAGVDISAQYSKTVDDLKGISFDYVITLCSHAAESCPVFPGSAKVIHRPFDDPYILAQNISSEEEALDIYRKVRDEIRVFVTELPSVIDPDKHLLRNLKL